MSNQQTPTVIGIDIGALTAKIGAVAKGAITIVTNEANFRQTPVVVGYGDGERKIGQMGQVKVKSNFKNTVVSPFRYLGLNANSPDVNKELMYCPCQTKWENQVLYFKVKINGEQQFFTAEQVMAAFLTQISQILQFNNLDDKMIVLSVPSFFTEIEKRALLNAAQISGVKNVKLITETIATGLDYGSFKKSEFQQGKNVVFVDFGYAKLSASLIRFTSDKMEVIIDKSVRNLGCRDIDQKIFEHISKKFEQKTGLNIKQNKKACLKLMDVIQKQRKILSGISETDISIECLMEDEDLFESLSRQDMLSISADIFNQATKFLESFRQEVQNLKINIDSVELLGGASRIPKFVEIVQQSFKTTPSRTTNSSETIAEGTTLAAVQFSNLFRFHSFKISNKAAHQIKISWRQQQTMQDQSAIAQSETIVNIGDLIPFEKHIKIPSSKKTQISIYYEGLQSHIESKIATIACQAPQNHNEINLKFEVTDQQFVVLKSVKDKQGNNIKFAVTNNKVLKAEDIQKFKAKQKQLFIRDFKIVQSYEKKNNLESFIYKQQDILKDEELMRYLSKAERQAFDNLLSQAKQKIQKDGENMTVSDYQRKKVEIENAIKNLRQSSKKAKGQVILYMKKLEDLKAYASQTNKQISQRFRNTQTVVEVFNKIKEIHEWADEAIKISKTKEISQLPVVPQKVIDQQYENIKILVNHLVNPGRPQPAQYPDQNMHQTARPRYQQQPQHHAQQPRRRPQQQQQAQYDPFGMSRSGFFPGGMFGNMSGFF